MITSGLDLSIINILIFLIISKNIKNVHINVQNVHFIIYYWLAFTIMTGIWEIFFVLNYNLITNYALELINNNEHVWTNNYNLTYLVPNKFSFLFYAEYGAYADREYMTLKDDWSIIIEGTHCILCGGIMICAILSILKSNLILFNIYLSIGMSSQLMNSIIYMGQYLIQINTLYSINYNSILFPCGKYLLKRPFMYINILWTIMPMYILYTILSEY